MGIPTAAPAVKRIAGLLGASIELLHEAQRVLGDAVAPVAWATEPARWTVSRYYEPEIGPETWRQYVALDGVMPPEDLIDLKLTTNALEARWSNAAGRPVNIDPGYVDLSRLVLASTKDAAHRVYLGRGIYAEVTLRFVSGQFEALAHTYADYAAADVRVFFTRVREGYRLELAAMRQAATRRGS